MIITHIEQIANAAKSPKDAEELHKFYAFLVAAHTGRTQEEAEKLVYGEEPAEAEGDA